MLHEHITPTQINNIINSGFSIVGIDEWGENETEFYLSYANHIRIYVEYVECPNSASNNCTIIIYDTPYVDGYLECPPTIHRLEGVTLNDVFSTDNMGKIISHMRLVK